MKCQVNGCKKEATEEQNIYFNEYDICLSLCEYHNRKIMEND